MREKLSQMKKSFFKFLLKQPVASLPFHNPTLSPTRSVTTVSIIPKEARRKHRSVSFREPSSPKVSCMGQVQCKKNTNAQKCKKNTNAQKKSYSVPCHEKKEKILTWIFKASGKDPKQSGRGFVSEDKEVKAPSTQIDPSLVAMKKFACGRGSLSHFDVAIER